MDAVNIEIDGRASIEHQIEIYVHDLFDVQDISLLEEILQGLHYLMNLRIKGNQQPHLDQALMTRLAKALLIITGRTEGQQLIKKRSTMEADMAFYLFGDFLQEVVEFRNAVHPIPVFELRDRLKIHYRCQPYSTETQKRGAVIMIQRLLSHFSYDSDGECWKDLVKKTEHQDMKKLLLLMGDAVAREQAAVNIALSESERGQPLPPQSLYFDRSLDRLSKMFPHLEGGLASTAVPSLHNHYGYNKLPDPPKPNALKMLWEQLTNFMVLILVLAAGVEAMEGDFNSMSVLLVVIVLNTVIGFSQEWKASKTLDALMHLSVPKAQVIRDSKQEMVASDDLVPGDIVVLEEGNAVPADLRLISVSQLQIEESILTGESLPVEKNTDAIKARTRRIPIGDCKGNAFMSTTVARGRGIGIVVRIGQDTEIGKISTAIQQGSKHKTKTPIQRKLDRLGKYLVLLAIVLCVLVVGIGLAWKKNVKHMLNVGLSLAVSVIPEGLVAVTTVTMALGVRRMAANKCIVRTLPAVESLGSVTAICSDKTGTLTEGKMGASELWTGDGILYRFTESTELDPTKGQILAYTTAHSPKPNNESQDSISSQDTLVASPNTEKCSKEELLQEKDAPCFHLKQAMMVAALCNNASVTFHNETQTWKSVGDPTEVPLVVVSQRAKLGKAYWETQLGYEKISEKAFDSERKLMSVSYKNNNSEQQENLVLCKGAPEELMRKCTHYYVDGQREIMNDHFSCSVSQESTRMACQGLRVLGLACKTIPSSAIDDRVEEGITFVGLVGLIDPPKQGVKEAIRTCQEAGIRVIMITGDHVKTATAIATKLGIFHPDTLDKNRAILGQELDLLSEDAIIQLNPFPCVFARVSPDNKLKIVKALQQRGELVAMTGDGVNDAPAIKSADVGVAMGEAGTEITKQAADLILLDDNFSTMVKAVEEGRHVFDNILKFIVYLLSCNGAEIFLMLICAVANMETPLTVMMILYANIIADIPPAMALGVEPKEIGLMKRQPRDPKQGVLTKVTWLIIFIQSMLMALLTIAVYAISIHYMHYTLASAQSLAFATITTLQLLHSFLSKSILQSVFVSGLISNGWMVCAFLVSFLFLVIGIYIPGVSSWLELSFVDGLSWLMVLLCCIVHISTVELQKWVIRRCKGKI